MKNVTKHSLFAVAGVLAAVLGVTSDASADTLSFIRGPTVAAYDLATLRGHTETVVGADIDHAYYFIQDCTAIMPTLPASICKPLQGSAVGVAGFPRFAQALRELNKLFSAVTVTFGPMSLFPDESPADWSTAGNVETRQYRGFFGGGKAWAPYTFFLDGMPFLEGGMPDVTMSIAFQPGGQNDRIDALTKYSTPMRARIWQGAPHATVDKLVTAFLGDLGGNGMRINFRSVQTASTYNFNTGRRLGGVFLSSLVLEKGPAPIVGIQLGNVVRPACGGEPTGEISVTAIGGNPPYSYLWSDNSLARDAHVSNLRQGDYSVTVTDAVGNSASLMYPMRCQ